MSIKLFDTLGVIFLINHFTELKMVANGCAVDISVVRRKTNSSWKSRQMLTLFPFGILNLS